MASNEINHFTGRFLGMRERDGWEYACRTNASGVVGMVAVTDNQEMVLVEQYRTPVECRVLELPAGLVGDSGDSDEAFIRAAERELLEETGFKASSMEELLTCPSSSGLTDELITLYYASGLQRVGSGGGTGSEDIKVHLVKLSEAVKWLEKRRQEGFLIDPKIFAGLFWAGLRT